MAGYSDTSISELETRIPLTVIADQTAITGEIDLFYCEAVDESLCFIDTFHIEIPLEVSDSAGANEVVLERGITPPMLNTP